MIPLSWPWLTLRYWAAQRFGAPLRLSPGQYITDGKRLWKADGPQEKAKAETPHDSDDGDSGTSPEHSKRARLRGTGNGRDARSGKRDHGLRQLRETTHRGHEGHADSEPRISLQQLRGVQRNPGLEKGIKLRQDLEYRIAYLKEHGRWRTTGQRWVRGELAIHIHLTVATGNGGADEFNALECCIDVEKGGLGDKRSLRGNHPIGLGRDHQLGHGPSGDRHYHSMFVMVREVPQKPHRPRHWPATVRLIAPNDCPIVRRNTGQPRIDAVLPIGEAGGHRKIDLLGLGWLWSGPDFYEVPCQMIQGSTEILEGIPEGQATFLADQGDGGRSDDSYCCVAGDLEIDLDGDGVGLRVKRPLQSRVKGFEVLLRPIELVPTVLERRIRHQGVALDHGTEGEAKNGKGPRDTGTDAGRLLP